MKDERWVDIKGWEGVYQISDYGRLKSFKQVEIGRILSIKNKNGWYFTVRLVGNNKKRETKRIHRLVAEYFVPNPEKKKQVNHIDRNKQNNHYKNIEWVTPRENMLHAVKTDDYFMRGVYYYNKIAKTKRVKQMTLDGELIAIYLNCHEAAEATGVCQRNIHQVASKTEYAPGKIRKRASRYRWEFVED